MASSGTTAFMGASRRRFDYEKLDVYELALEFVVLVHESLKRIPGGRTPLADQLDRAALSIVLNTAEGSGEFRRREKARFYRMALRSVSECAAALDVGHRLGALPGEHHTAGKELLHRIAAMLTSLVRRHDLQGP